jgi:hypothetical protein
LGTPASLGEGFGASDFFGVLMPRADVFGAAVSPADVFGVGGATVVVTLAAVGVAVVGLGDDVVVVGRSVVVVTDGFSDGVVRPVHGVRGEAAGLDEDATTAGGTVTVVLRGADFSPVTALRRASGCSSTTVVSVVSGACSVSMDVVSLTLVTCGRPSDGAAAWSSWPLSSVVSPTRPANAAMGAIITAAKHPRPLAGSSR